MVRLTFVMALAACSFRPQAAPGGDGAPKPDGGGGGGDADAPGDGPSATCFGTSGLASVCPADSPTGAVTLTGTIVTDPGSSSCAALTPASTDVCLIAGASI